MSTQKLSRRYLQSFIHNRQDLEATKMSVGECVNEVQYFQTMEYFLMLKRNQLSSYEKTWKKKKDMEET